MDESESQETQSNTGAEAPVGSVESTPFLQIGADHKNEKGRPYLPFEQKDDVIGQFNLLPKERMEQLDTKTAQAYKVEDPKNTNRPFIRTSMQQAYSNTC